MNPKDLEELLAEKTRIADSIQKQSPSDAAAPIVAALETEGIAIVPDAICPDEVAAMRKNMPSESQFERGFEGVETLYYRNARQLPQYSSFFDSELVSDVVRAYVSDTADAIRNTITLKNVAGDINCFESFFHIDTWKPRLKVFMLLENTTASHGPLAYLKGSHVGEWRLPMEVRIKTEYRTDEQGFAAPESYYIGCYWPHEIQALKEQYGFEEILGVGNAGTLIFFDGRGLHRASPIADGMRRINLMSYWIHRDEHT